MPTTVRGLWAACSVRSVSAVACAALSAAGMALGSGADPAPAPAARVAPISAQTSSATTSSAASTTSSTTSSTTGTTISPTTPDVRPSCDQDVKPGHFACFALRRTNVPSASTRAKGGFAPRVFTAQTSVSGLRPADLAAAYSLPTSIGGKGQTVYVVDAFAYPDAESDLSMYRAQFGLPACTTGNGCFRKVNQRGAVSPLPGADKTDGWDAETALDLDMVSAVCPNCHITLVESDDDSNNMLVAVKEAQTLGAKFVSMSWGASEDGRDSTYDTAYFAKTGVVYTASSGDDGYKAGPIYPATSARVVAVGGTTLKHSTSSRGWSETAWSDAGSGCSDEEARPSWQTASTIYCSRRGTTDVSAVANPDTGVAVYVTDVAGTQADPGWNVFGGTSASAPIIAATYALVGTPASGTNPASFLYQHPGSLYDVSSGSNGSCSGSALCHAVHGWDGPTGLGTPHGLEAFGPNRTTTATGVVIPGRTTTGVQQDGTVVPSRTAQG